MVDFARTIAMNNTLVIMYIFSFIILLSILACDKIRKVIIGSIISTAVTITLAFIPKIDAINDLLNLVYKYFMNSVSSKISMNLIHLNRNVLIIVSVLGQECIDNLLYANIYYFTNITKNAALNVNAVLCYVKSYSIKKISFARKCYVIRI